jgi:hypothetical protein
MEAKTEKYLRLPVYVGRLRVKTFEYLKDRIWKKLQGWLERMLSKAGKDILIKACAQAIPTFDMSCFDLTQTLCNQISAMICRFWWAQHDKENKVHWLSWEVLSKSKEEGGLGFRDLYGFNLAMLAQQAWRMLTNPESLCAMVLKARYFPDCSILQATAGPGISYSWRSIVKGINLLKEGLIWRVGDGSSINIWSDPWLARNGSLQPITPKGRNCLLNTVSELIDPVSNQWDEALVRDTFWGVDAGILFLQHQFVMTLRTLQPGILIAREGSQLSRHIMFMSDREIVMYRLCQAVLMMTSCGRNYGSCRACQRLSNLFGDLPTIVFL